MPRLEPESGKVKWYKSDGAKSVYASLISILIGLAVGMIVIIIVGLAKDNISMKGIWDGIRLVFLGVFSTGRVEGQLTFGFNPINLGNMLFRATPLILTGLSVAVAFKTGLFNIGAAGQYVAGTVACDGEHFRGDLDGDKRVSCRSCLGMCIPYGNCARSSLGSNPGTL